MLPAVLLWPPPFPLLQHHSISELHTTHSQHTTQRLFTHRHYGFHRKVSSLGPGDGASRSRTRGVRVCSLLCGWSLTCAPSDICKIILAIFLPPVGVFLERGCNADFWINILLTCLGKPSPIQSVRRDEVGQRWNGDPGPPDLQPRAARRALRSSHELANMSSF